MLHNILKIWKKISEIAKNWRSLEPRICNFCQIFLHRLTKCIILKSIFVNNLSLVIVRIPLVWSAQYSLCTDLVTVTENSSVRLNLRWKMEGGRSFYCNRFLTWFDTSCEKTTGQLTSLYKSKQMHVNSILVSCLSNLWIQI